MIKVVYYVGTNAKDTLQRELDDISFAKVDTWVNNNITEYDLNVPSDMTEQEQKDYYNAIVRFAKSIQ